MFLCNWCRRFCSPAEVPIKLGRLFLRSWREFSVFLLKKQHSPTSLPSHTKRCPFNVSPWKNPNHSLQHFRPSSLLASSDTVFALSSGQGKCGVAVVRISGPQTQEALLQITRLRSPPKPRHALFRKLADPYSADTIDHGLVLWFPGPYSFTGEDSVEFQVHGGPSVVLALLTALAKIPGCRHAEPGDFTKRAFFNGKLDLTEVEGLADLIHAETEAQRKQALRQMEGDLGKLYEHWSKALLHSVAHVEAVIDFGEDENIEEGVLPQVKEEVKLLLKEIRHHLDDGRRGERLRSGVHVTIVGAPNAGKSSLLNILCQRPAAIVSPYAGTTRDVLESTLDIYGYPIVLSDTAGLREAEDPVEQEGVRRALNRAETADLKILIADCSLLNRELEFPNPNLLELARTLLQLETVNKKEAWTEKTLEVFSADDTIIVLNKTDLIPVELTGRNLGTNIQDVSVCWLSCKTGEGVDAFMHTLKTQLENLCGNPLAGNPSLTQARHRQHLTLCASYLESFLGQLAKENELLFDLAAEELRMAIRQIGSITGKVGVEEILDVVFRDFCIGK